MARVCTQVTEWIQQQVSKPIEDWVERTEEKCKKRKWYDPRRWLCWLVTTLVSVIRWVVVTVVTAVVTVVCRLVSDLLSLIWDLLQFIGNLILALVTWDKCRLKAAISNLADAFEEAFAMLGDVLIRPIVDRVQTNRLRKFVEEQIDDKYGALSEQSEAIKAKLNVRSGVFGYRLTMTVHRMFLDSETKTPTSGDLPNLIYLHENGLINLYEVSGLDKSCAIFSGDSWGQPIHSTALKTYVGGGGGLLDTEPPGINRDELKKYIESRGASGPAFYIFAMPNWMQKASLETAEELGRQLGLLINFDVKGKEVTDHRYIANYQTEAADIGDGADCQAVAKKGQPHFLICELGLHTKRDFNCCGPDELVHKVVGDLEAARRDLCNPSVVGAFVVMDAETRISGVANCFVAIGGDVKVPTSGRATATGASFTAKQPVKFRKYVLIHELGHYFSLAHVNGLDRIMATVEDNPGEDNDFGLISWSNFWRVIPNFIIHGGPRFIYVEAERTWKFILANYPSECLGASIIE